MNQEQNMDVRSASLLNVILGAWLIISPFILNYTSSAARWDQVIIGIAVVVLAGIRTFMPSQRWLSSLVGLAGLWAIIAPFILSYDRSVAYWNQIIIGAVIALVAFVNSSMSVERTTPTTPPR